MDSTDQRPAYRVLSTRTIALSAAALVVIGVGVGVWLLIAYGDGTVESLSAALDRALRPEVAAKAKAVAAEMAPNGVEIAADLLVTG